MFMCSVEDTTHYSTSFNCLCLMFMCSVEDTTHYSTSFNNLTFKPGEVLRHFVKVPVCATWAGK